MVVTASHDTLVGCLKTDDKKGYLIVNYTDPIRQHTNLVSVSLLNKQSAVCVMNDKKMVNENGRFQLEITPGNAAFIFYEQK